MNKKTLSIIGLIVALGVIGFLMKGGNEQVNVEQEIKNELVIQPQPSGAKITIANVNVNHPIWVAIYTNINGQPDTIIASRLFEVGTHTNQTLELLKGATTPQGQYFGVMRSDDGNEQLDPAQDLPTKDAQGNLIIIPFTTE